MYRSVTGNMNLDDEAFFPQYESLVDWFMEDYPWIQWKQLRDLNSLIPEFNNQQVDYQIYKRGTEVTAIEVSSTMNEASFIIRMPLQYYIVEYASTNIRLLHEQDSAGYKFCVIKLTGYTGRIVFE